jgi:hypothetical protein
MLQAMQATLIYGMLCSQYTEFVSKDDAAWVVETIEVSYHPCQDSHATLLCR